MHAVFCGNFNAKLTQGDFLQDFVNRSGWLQEALEIDEFFHIGMEVGLLLDGVAYLQEELFVNQLLDAANGEVWHEVLTVAEVAQLVEGIQKVGFEVEQCLGLVVHAEPKDTRHVVAAEKAGAVEVEGEGFVFFGYLLASLDDGGDILCRGITDKLQG